MHGEDLGEMIRFLVMEFKLNYMKKIIFIFLIAISSFLNVRAQGAVAFSGTIEFRPGSNILARDYKNNDQLLNSAVNWLNTAYMEAAPNSHIHIVAHYKDNTPAAINQACVRASTLRAHMRMFGHKELRYTFALQHSSTANRIDFYCNSTAAPTTVYNDIHYTFSNATAQISSTLARYPASVYVAGGVLTETPVISPSIYLPAGVFTNTYLDSLQNISRGEAIYFRCDKHFLDKMYMGNDLTLAHIDHLLSNSILQSEMDSIVVTATASPEGDPNHNQRLSERRLKTMLDYFNGRFPAIHASKYRPYALGEDWEGLYRMVNEDLNVPHRMEVMALCRLPIPLAERERRLRRLGGGTAYQYISRNILQYLRTGATLVLFYPKKFEKVQSSAPLDMPTKFEMISVNKDIPLEPMYFPLPPLPQPDYHYIRPFAIKTNLLFDAATLFNIEAEVPLGRRFSVLAEWTFPFWGGLGNAGGVAPVPTYSERYTLQMLSGGLEARYWFPRSESLDNKAQRWGDYNPLNGWFVGLYGGAGLYDFQWNGKGMQGEFYIASGISAGYAHPIGKYFHMEYSLGFGYVATRYYNYTAMDGHKVVDIRPDGKYDRRQQSFFGPTKLKIALVWIPRFKVNNKKENPANEK